MLGKKLLSVVRPSGIRNVLYGWGSPPGGNDSFEDGTPYQNRSSPVQVGSKSWNSVINTSGGFAGIDDIYRLWFKGNIGLPYKTTPYLWNNVSIGNSTTAAIRSDGTLWVWGTVANGGLGVNTPSLGLSSPVQIGTSSWSMVAVGNAVGTAGHMAAIRSDGALFTWGLNQNGQLGLGDNINRSSPIQVGTDSWTTVAAGPALTAAVRKDGALFTWGSNTAGALGVSGDRYSWIALAPLGNFGTAAIRSDGTLWGWGSSSLVPAITYTSWNTVAAGFYGGMAIRSDGTLWGWGYNNTGELGVGDILGRSSPSQVGTSSWTMVDMGPEFGENTVGAIRSDGTLWGWGANGNGQLGLNDLVHRSSPVQVGTSSWAAVSANGRYTAAIRTDGALFMWGRNNFGQLGQNDSNHRSSPVQVGTSSWTAIAVAHGSTGGSGITFAIRSDGTLWGWGANGNGQLGLNDLVHRSSPVQVGTSSWTSVSVGTSFVAALRADNTLWTWGNNSLGQLGQSDTIHRSSPVQVGTSSWTSISAAGAVLMAKRNDNTIWSWGHNNNGQLGLNNLVNCSSPVQVGTSSWTNISAGALRGIAIDSTNSLYVWGDGTHAGNGMQELVHRSSPVQLPLYNINARSSPAQLHSGSWTSLIGTGTNIAAIRSDGTLWGWGTNSLGLFGTNDQLRRFLPTQIMPGSWAQVSIGGSSLIARRSDGTLWAIGDNTAGQLGLNDRAHRSSPVQIGTSNWLRVSVGGSHAVAIRSDNTLWGWGNGTHGAVGDGTGISRSSPVQISASSWTAVSAGFRHSLAIRSDTTLWGWGGDATYSIGELDGVRSSWTTGALWNWGLAIIRSDGALFTTAQLGSHAGTTGDGTTIARSSPVQVGTSSWAQVSANASTIYAIRSDGALFAWGLNSSGEIGDNTVTPKSSPVQIGTSSWTMVRGANGSGSHVAAIRSDGALFIWGNNSNGVLGLNDLVHRSSPVQVGTSSWTSVDTGLNMTLAIRSDGTLWSWGSSTTGKLAETVNFARVYKDVTNSINGKLAITTDGALFTWGFNGGGELGLNDTAHRSSPVQVGTSSWAMVSASQEQGAAAAIRSDGGLFTWGPDGVGKLGQGGTAHRSSPVQVGTSSWAMVSNGAGHMAAIRSDGALFTWGTNGNGQLGQGNTTSLSSPIQVGTSSWSAVDCGLSHTAAIRSDGALFAWGLNTNGQLGLNDLVHRSSPVQVGTSSWTAVSTGSRHTLAISSNQVWAWGLNTNGRLGDWSTIHRSSPVLIGFDPQGSFTDLQYKGSWVAVAAGVDSSIALLADGTAYWWGNNNLGQGSGPLADNSASAYSRPVQIGLPFAGSFYNSNGSHDYNKQYSLITKSNQYTGAAIGLGKTLFVWGYVSAKTWRGELGLNETADKNSPVQLGGLPAALVDRSSPVQIGVGPAGWTKIQAAPGAPACFAIRDDYTLWAWGSNSQNGTQYTSAGGDAISSPVMIGGRRSWSQVVGGGSNNGSIALEIGGRVWATGGNQYGLMSPITRSYSSGTKELIVSETFSNIVSVAAGGLGRSLMFVSDGSVWAAASVAFNGYASFAYGNGPVKLQPFKGLTTISRSSPVQIDAGIGGSFTGWSDVSCPTNVVNIARKTDGSIWVWGSNQQGVAGIRDGTGSNDNSNIPAAAVNYEIQANNASNQFNDPTRLNFYSWSFLPASCVENAAGHNTVGAIRSDGALFMWGGNTNGQLGDGTLTHRSVATQIGRGAIVSSNSPIQVGTSSWTKVFAIPTNNVGNTFTALHAIRSDGALFTWGSNPNSGAQATANRFFKNIGFIENAAFAIDVHDEMFVWGTSTNFENGGGFGNDRSFPVQLGTWVSGFFVKKAFGGGGNAIVQLQNGDWVGWGTNKYGQLLLPNRFFSRVGPNTIQQLQTKNWTSISPGRTAYGITTDGALWGWGKGTFNAFLNDSDQPQSSPVQIGTSSWTSVRTNTALNQGIPLPVFVIRSDGALFAWGNNPNGTIGIGDTAPRSSPVQIGTSSWTSVSVGITHVAAIRSDGALFTWGANDVGQLGLNDRVHRSSPVQIGTSSWTSVSTYGPFTLAIRSDGALFAWGNNGNGELGQNNIIDRSSPVQVGTNSNWTQIATARFNSAAMNNLGVVYIWGQSGNGVNGDEAVAFRSSPVMLAAPISGSSRSSPVLIGAVGDDYNSWAMVAANGSTIHAIRADGRLYGSGSGADGQLGNNTTSSRFMFSQIGTNSWSSVASGTHPIGIQSDGTIWTWGNGSVGGLGDSLGPEREWAQISIAGPFVAGAIETTGALFTWGSDTYSALGHNTNSVHRSSPTQVGTSSWTTLSMTHNHSLAVRSDGALFAWGLNGNGELGLIDRINRSSPVQVGTSSWVLVSVGYASAFNASTAAIRADGGLFTWGQDLSGSAGHNTLQNRRSSPTQVGTSSWTFVSYSGGSTCVALRTDGALFTWGANGNGQLGQGNTISRSSPVQVGTSSWTAVCNGDGYVLAIRSDGALFAWGLNTNGQLGLNDLVHRSSPVQVGVSSWTAVSGGGGVAHAIRADGTLWGWGNSTDGLVGDGQIIHRSSPVQIGPIYNKFTKISSFQFVNGNGALAVDRDNRLWAWGSSITRPRSPAPRAFSSPTQVGADAPFNSGILGGHTVFRSSPVILGGGSGWTSVAAQNDTYGAIRNGELYMWGSNNLGRTGIGLNANNGHRSAPQQVGGNYYFNEGGAFRDTSSGSWAMISSTYGNHFGGIKTDGSLWLWGWNGAGQASPEYHIWYGTVSSGAGNALSSPTQLGTSSWSVVSTGQTHTAAIRSDGRLFVWGFNSSGQVGDNTTIHRSSPLQVGTSSWISVAAGTSQTAAVRSDGTLWVWGANFFGELGQNNTIHRSSPVQVGTATAWKYVVANESNLFALGTGNGNLWSIGGATGLNIAATTPLFSWSKVSVGGSHSMAIRSDGTLWTWGDNTSGVLGQNDRVHRSSPVQVGTSSWTQISAGRGSTNPFAGTSFAIRSDGALFAWGLNDLGQHGLNDSIPRSSPVQVGTSSWIAVATHSQNIATVLAIRNDGALFTWGDNSAGQLGLNDLVHRSSPVQVGTSSWTQVAAAAQNNALGTSLAIRSDGGLFTWGRNVNGELGLNDRNHRSSPVQVGTSSWTQLAVRGTAAIRLDGGLFMWGLNGNGELGLNDRNHRSSPVQVGTNSWIAVTTGASTSAIRSDNVVFMWGYARGADAPLLGRHDGISRSSPVQIVSAGTSAWSAIDGWYIGAPFAGQRTMAIGTNGLLYAWGDNAAGQLGFNNTVLFAQVIGNFMPQVIGSTFVSATRSSPVQVTSQDSWIWIGSGSMYTASGIMVAQKNDGTLWAWGNVNARPFGIPFSGANRVFASPVQIVGTDIRTTWALAQASSGLFPAATGTPSGALLSI
jgi:alpha-tubulin suppressor-like RCC1 family protein